LSHEVWSVLNARIARIAIPQLIVKFICKPIIVVDELVARFTSTCLHET